MMRTSPQPALVPLPDRRQRLNDYYSILGVTPSATVDEIRRAFRRLARRYHPDVNPDPDASERFHEINTAYRTLADPSRRAEYDANRDSGVASRSGSGPEGQQNVRRFYFQRRVRAATDPRATWNYYDILGVQPNAPEQTIVRAYQRLYREFYPGREHDPGTAAILQEIAEARDVLIDPERRLAYDRLPPDQQPPGRPRTYDSKADRPNSSNFRGRRRTGFLFKTLLHPAVVLATSIRRILAARRAGAGLRK